MPLPGTQAIRNQKGEPRPKERTGPATQHQLGNRQTVVFITLTVALGACVYFANRWEDQSFPGSNRRI